MNQENSKSWMPQLSTSAKSVRQVQSLQTRRARAKVVSAVVTRSKIRLPARSAKDVQRVNLYPTTKRRVSHVKVENFKIRQQRSSTSASFAPRAQSSRTKTHHAHCAPVKRINLTTTFLPQNVPSVVMEERLTHSPHHARAA